MNVKSERLKKLETELRDLEQWLKLGLVPKKDVDKHKEEIKGLKTKIDEEKERLRFLKESGAMEEYAPPKRGPHGKSALPEAHTMPDIDIGEEGMTEAGLDMETEAFDVETTEEETFGEEKEEGEESPSIVEEEEEEEEDPFSDRNRWRRGVLEDPDQDQW